MVVGGWVLTHNLVKPTLLVKVELGFDHKGLGPTTYPLSLHWMVVFHLPPLDSYPPGIFVSMGDFLGPVR